MAKFVNETQSMSKAVDKMSSQINSALGQVKNAFAGVTAGIALGKVAQMADEYNVLQARIQQATKATGDYLGVSQQLQRISQQTGASLKDSTDVFQRLSLAAGNLGASNKQLLSLTATVQKLGVMGGASTQALNAGLLQFGQAMGAGIVRAEEFNSIIENMPLVAQKIAEGMGMTTAELRKLVLSGKVASKDVFDSLLKQSEAISKEFEKMPVSLGRATANLKGSIEAALGKLDSSIGVTKTLAAGLQKVADNGTLAVNAITGLAAGAAIFKIMTIDIAATTAAMSALATSVAAATGGLSLVAAAVATGVAALIAFRDESITLGDKTVTIANLMQATWLSVSETVQRAWNAIAGGVSGMFDKVAKSVQGLLAHIYSKMADGEAHAGTMRYAFKRMWDGIAEGARVVQRSFETMFSDKHYEPIRQMFSAIGGSIDSVVQRASALTQAQKEQAKVSEKVIAAAQKQQEEDEKARKKHESALEWVKKLVEEWDRQAEVVGKVTAQEKVMMDLEKAIAEIKRKHLTVDEKAAAIAQLRIDAAARVYNLNQVAYAKDLESLDKIAEKWAQRAEKAKALTDEQKILLELEEDIKKINAEHVGQLDKEVKIMQIKARAQTEIANKKAAEVAKEREQFQKSLDDLEIEAKALERKLAGLPEMTEQMKLQALLEKEIAKGSTENLDILEKRIQKQKYIDELKQKEKEQKYLEDELKRIDEITAGYKDQQQAILAKANGYEHMLPLLKEERKIQEDIKKIKDSTTFTQDEKDTKVQELQQKLQAIREGHALTQQFNAQVEAQEKLISKITGSTKGYYNQIADLKQAFQTGQITLHQYTEAWKKLQEGTKSASVAGKEFGDLVGKAFEDNIINGKKLTDVFKDLGKELKNMAIRKLLIDPIKEKSALAFDAIGRNLFGIGKGNYNQPGLPPGVAPGQIAGLPNNPLAQNAAASGVAAPGNLLPAALQTQQPSMAPIYSYGPVTLNGGTVSMNNPQLPTMAFNNVGSGGGTFNSGSGFLGGGLGNLLGAPFRALGLGGGSGGGLFGGGGGGLLGGLGGLFSNALNPLRGLIGGAQNGYNMGGGGLMGILAGLSGGLGGLLGGSIGSLKNLFGGGSGGMLGGLGGLFGGGPQIAGPINPASQSSIFGGLGSLGGLFNPLGLLGGIGKAAGSTIGGDTIFKNIAPLFNPLGLFKGLGSAIGTVFGGAREFGGDVWGGQSFLVGESGPELFVPKTNGYIMSNSRTMGAFESGSWANPFPQTQQEYFFGPNHYRLGSESAAYQQMFDAVTMKPGGTPLYQQMGSSFQRDFSVFNSYDKAGDTGDQGWQIQALLAKRDAYRMMTPDQQQQARTTGDGYFNNADSIHLFDLINNQSLAISSQFNQLYGDQLDAGVSAILNNDGFGGNLKSWAALTQGNKTFSALGKGNNLMRSKLPDGNQLGNIVNRWSFAGVRPSEMLNNFANTRDSLMDELMPFGGWQLQGYGYNSMGMGGGMGAPRADSYEGDRTHEAYSWGGNNPQRAITQNTIGWGNNPLKQLTNDTAGWGSGIGYNYLKWQPTGTPFQNNSLLLQGKSVYHPNPIAKALGFPSSSGVNVAPGMSTSPAFGEFKFDPSKLFNQAAWEGNKFGRPGWETVPSFMPGQTEVYGSPRNASGGFAIDPQGIKQGWQSGFDYLSKMGYRPEAGWSLGDWSNTLHSMSSYLGFKQPNKDYQRNIGTGGTQSSPSFDWTQYNVPSPLDNMPRPTGSSPLTAIGKALGGVMGGDNILRDILPLMNPFGFAKGLQSAAGTTMGGLIQSKDPFVAARNAASDSWKQFQALSGDFQGATTGGTVFGGNGPAAGVGGFASGVTDWFKSHQDLIKSAWGQYQQWNPNANTNPYLDSAKLFGQMAFSGWNNNAELQIRTSMALQDFAKNNPWAIPYIQKVSGGLGTLGSLLGPMPNRQMGGPVDPGFYQWNENGREYFATSKKGEVIPASDIRKNQAPQITIHNYASSTHEATAAVNAEGIIDIVFREIQRALPAVPQRVRI